MADLRGATLGALAASANLEVRGDAAYGVRAVRALEQAGAHELSFVLDSRYRARACASSAGALLVPPALADLDRPLLVAADPKLALAHVLRMLYPPLRPLVGVHPTAVVEDGCAIDAQASVGPYAVIGAGSQIAAAAVVGAHTVLGCDCRIGAGAVLHPHVVLYERTQIGAHTIIHAGSVLGADGFGYAHTEGGHVKLPHVGRTVIGEGVEIGALAAVDRALAEETRIGDGTKIDNLVQVGHNVTVGRGCLLCGQVGLAGTAQLDDFVVMGGQSGAGDHVRIGKGAQVAARSAVLRSIDDGAVVGGVPAIDLKAWRRQALAAGRLGDWARRLRALERALERALASEGPGPEDRPLPKRRDPVDGSER